MHLFTEMDEDILHCEKIIERCGGKVDRGWIQYDGCDEQALKAMQYLLEEWDYAVGPHPDFQQWPPRQEAPELWNWGLAISFLILAIGTLCVSFVLNWCKRL